MKAPEGPANKQRTPRAARMPVKDAAPTSHENVIAPEPDSSGKTHSAGVASTSLDQDRTPHEGGQDTAQATDRESGELAGSGDDGVPVDTMPEPGSPADYEARIQAITRRQARLLIDAAGLTGRQADSAYEVVESDVRFQMRQFQLNDEAAFANSNGN